MLIPRSVYKGTLTIPASKSQTIRALLIALMARGKSIIHHPLYSSDTLSAVNAVKALGAEIKEYEDGTIIVDSTELDESTSPLTIDCANSGTTTALLIPILALSKRIFTVTGDEQLRKRPFLPLVNALRNLGAEVESAGGFPPICIKGPMKGGETVIECRSSQYLSGLLLSLPLAQNDSKVTCSLLFEKPYVRMTEKWLKEQNIRFTLSDDLMVSRIRGRQKYTPFETYIEGDFSSASFFFVLAAIHSSAITVSGLDRNTTQGDRRILDVLEKMGCAVSWEGMSVTVTGPEKIRGGIFDINDIPDALPALTVAACYSNETIQLTNVAQARIKETDRIKVMHEELEKLGADIEEKPDGLIIKGRGHLNGGKVSGHNDHRVIMALSVAGTKADGDVEIDSTQSAAVTFPTFYNILEELRA